MAYKKTYLGYAAAAFRNGLDHNGDVMVWWMPSSDKISVIGTTRRRRIAKALPAEAVLVGRYLVGTHTRVFLDDLAATRGAG